MCVLPRSVRKRKDDKPNQIPQAIRLLIQILLVAVVYYAAARLGLLLAFEHTNASPVWPPSGIAFAAMLLCGYRIWPGIFLGAFFSNLIVFLAHFSHEPGTVALVSCAIGIGNTLEAVIGTFLLRRLTAYSNPFLKIADVFKFLVTALLMCSLGASVGTASLLLSKLVPPSLFGVIWYTWWLGDVTSVLIVAPFILRCFMKPFFRPRFDALAVFIAVSSVFLLIGGIIFFGGTFESHFVQEVFVYFLIPFVCWSAFRFGHTGVVLSAIGIAGITVWGTKEGIGPFVRPLFHESLLLLQTFLGLTTATGLILAAALREIQTAQEMTREREQELRDLIENASIGIHWVGPDGRILWANRAELDMLGYLPEEYLGHSVDEFYVNEEEGEDFLRRLAHEEPLRNYEIRLRHKNGSIRHILMNSNIFRKRGEFIHMRCFTRDISQRKWAEESLKKAHDDLEIRVAERTSDLTQVNKKLAEEVAVRKKTEEALETSRKELREYIDSMSTYTAKIDLNGNILMANQIAVSTSGLSYDELLKTNFLEGEWWSAEPEVRARVSEAFRQAANGTAVNYDEKLRLATGKVIFINFSVVPVRGPDGYVKYILAEGRDINVQKHAEEALRSSENRVRKIIETANDAFIEIDSRGAILTWNKQAEISFGWAQVEILGKTLNDTVIPPRYREAHRMGFERFLATGTGPILNRRIELTALHRDGHEFPVELTVWPVRVQGEYHFNSFLRDISERRRAEFAARQLAAIVESSEDAVFGAKLDGIIFSCNQSAEKMFGFSAEELITQPLDRLFQPEQKGMLDSIRLKILRGEHVEHFETVGFAKKNRKIYVSLSVAPIYDLNGNISGVSMIARDVTERKRAEEEIRHIRDQRELILNSTADGIYVLDRAGKVSFVNAAASRMLQFSFDELVGKNLHELIHHTKANGSSFRWRDCPTYGVLQQGLIREVREDIFWTKKRKAFSVEYVSAPLKSEGEVTGAVVVFRDTTLRRMKEEIDVKSQFISVVSHELRTPLTVIKDALEIALNGSVGELNFQQKDFLVTAKRNADRLSRLITNVLDFQRLELGQMRYNIESHDINAVAEEVEATMTSLVKSKGLAFESQLTQNIPHAVFDRDKVTQVIVNLVDNAVKFTDKGRIRVMTEQVDSWIRISVQDTGIGIQEEDIPKLFTTFGQVGPVKNRKTGGAGLGLAICKKVIEQHGGTIKVQSKPGEGSSFSFTLPIEH